MDRIKVLHLITHLGVGGAQDNTLQTVKKHSRQRYQVDLAAGQDYTDWVERGRSYADAFFAFPDLRRAVSPTADWRALDQLTAFLHRRPYDIVHTHSSKAGILGRIAARRAGVPVIVHTIHGFGWQVTSPATSRPWQRAAGQVEKWYYVLLERYAASLSDALITVCDLNRQEAIRLKLAPPAKLTTIYSGIDLEHFDVTVNRAEKLRSLGLNPHWPVIGTVGRLCTQKAPLDWVAAAKIVLQCKPHMQFVWVGDGPLAAAVQQAIGDERRIRVFGYRDDVPEILAVLDIFALSSLWEGLGRALTEAMIVGVPVAATAVDGVPELVKHHETGLLSAPGNPAQLANNLVWLLDHPLAAQTMKDRAQKQVVPAFGAERMVERIEGLYERLLDAKENARAAQGVPAWSRPWLGRTTQR